MCVPFACLLLVLAAASPPASAGAEASRWIVALTPPVDTARLTARGMRVLARLGAATGRGEALPWAFDPSRIVLVEASGDSVAAMLGSDPAVAWFEPELVREPCIWAIGAPGVMAPVDGRPDAFPNDPLYREGRQWGLDQVRAPAAWATSVGNDAVRLAVCDTGVDPAHPDLAGSLRDGSPRLVEGVDVTTPGASFADSVAHGTLVAGVMAARTHDGPHFESLGIAGVCGGDGVTTAGCRLIPVRITRAGSRGASSFAIARGILHAADAGARAINLSFAAGGASRTERLAMLDALARGAVVVCAAGNNGVRDGAAAMYPAAHSADGLCGQVGASDPRGDLCAFSSHGPGLDLIAPGLDIWTTYMTYPSAADWWQSPYVAASGTSFAAPFATGTIGLLAAARPELAPEDFQHVLRLSARDVGAPGPDSLTGCGVLDAAAALALVGPGTALWHGEARPVVAEVSRDTLVVTERGIALLDSLGRRALAERWTLRARVSVPDSLGDSAHAWVRVSGTATTRGDWRVLYVTPWASLRRVGARMVEFEGALFRVVDARADRLAAPDDPARWIPVPSEQARIAFTVMGGRRGPGEPPAPAPRATTIRVSPNPARGAVSLAGPPGAEVRIVDMAGRVVGRLVLGSADGRARWEGLGPSGRAVAPGLYWAIGPGGEATRFVRLR